MMLKTETEKLQSRLQRIDQDSDRQYQAWLRSTLMNLRMRNESEDERASSVVDESGKENLLVLK